MYASKGNPENRFSRIRKKRPDLFSSEYCEPGWIVVCREHHGTVPGCKNFAVPECGLLCPPSFGCHEGLREVTES